MRAIQCGAFLWLVGAGGAVLAQDGDAVTVPFELKSNIIFVEVTINGEGPFSFIFDTGASVTVIRRGTAGPTGSRRGTRKGSV